MCTRISVIVNKLCVCVYLLHCTALSQRHKAILPPSFVKRNLHINVLCALKKLFAGLHRSYLYFIWICCGNITAIQHMYGRS